MDQIIGLERNVYLSVIVPAYNAEPYLEQCISSIKGQSYSDIQIILVDDGSTDRTGLICDKYAESDARIEVIHKPNGGLVSARKAGLKAAKGVFVGWADADDWVETDYYEQMVRAQEKSGADLVAAGHFHDIGEESGKVWNQIPAGLYQRGDILPKLIYSGTFFTYGLQPHIYTKLIRREILDKTQMAVDERICAGEDAAVVYPSVLEAEHILVTDICGYHYVQHPGSITKTGNENERERMHIFMNYLAHAFTKKGVLEILKPQLIQYKKYFVLLRQIQMLDEWVLMPYGGIPVKSRVVLYGAGVLGQKIYRYLTGNDLASVVCWLDRNAESYSRQGLDVRQPKEIQNLEGLYDYVLIANTIESTADSIRKYLMELNVPEEKIRWFSESFVDVKEAVWNE